jgi:hypothetical protein
MVLTMRPERRKSRPRGSTTSTSGIAMAGRRRFQSRRGGVRREAAVEKLAAALLPRREVSELRWAKAAPPATRRTGHTRPRIRRFLL